ncbi:HAD family hydrolase [Microvirga sp. 2YAF29]|uniref:HAD family hydrolase n=1 Tax=Microvirga sp. 2YAF29 TaxID=3233031 RepID=UPI003F9A7012
MLKALIFDMDGTLVHSDPIHLRAFAEVLGPQGVAIDDEIYHSTIIGRTNPAIFASLLPHLGVEDHEAFADEKEAAFRRLALDLEPLAGLMEVLDWAKAQGIKIALVTNAPRLNADHMLDVLGLASYFPVQITIDQVERGKPDPLPYLTALERLGVRADEAIAFEDSPSGMKAAKGAGIYSFGVLTGLSAGEMMKAGADATLADFHDAGLWNLLKQKSAA